MEAVIDYRYVGYRYVGYRHINYMYVGYRYIEYIFSPAQIMRDFSNLRHKSQKSILRRLYPLKAFWISCPHFEIFRIVGFKEGGGALYGGRGYVGYQG